VPRYEEALKMLFYYLPKNYEYKRVLELGCGTGNLTGLIVKHIPEAKITAVDISEKMILECKARLKKDTIDYIREDFSRLKFKEESFNLIISSIAIHHLVDSEKEKLFYNIYKWLKKGGIFIFFDPLSLEIDALHKENMRLWKNFAFENNVTEAEWNMFLEHQKESDFYSSLRSHIGWLERGGFKNIDCIWRYSFFSIVYAEKI
jgi:tRNA (cmo5U34)-methyltransferase